MDRILTLVDFVRDLDQHLRERGIPYALWGGCAVSCHIGYIHRKLGDIDMICDSSHWTGVSDVLCTQGVDPSTDKYSKLSGYKAFEGSGKQLKVQVFPLHFRIIDPQCSEAAASYDFSTGMCARDDSVLKYLERGVEARTSVLPFEDIVTTKLMLPLCPPHTTDLILLLRRVPKRTQLSVCVTEACRQPWVATRVANNLALLRKLAVGGPKHMMGGGTRKANSDLCEAIHAPGEPRCL